MIEPIGNETVSPELMVFEVVSDERNSSTPPELALMPQNSTTVPQPALGVAKFTAMLFEVVPPVPALAAVEPALCVPAQLVSELAIEARA